MGAEGDQWSSLRTARPQAAARAHFNAECPRAPAAGARRPPSSSGQRWLDGPGSLAEMPLSVRAQSDPRPKGFAVRFTGWMTGEG